MNIHIKDMFDKIVAALERAKVSGLIPRIDPEGSQYTISLEGSEFQYSVKLVQARQGAAIKTYASGMPQDETELPDASIQDALRIIQAAIIIAYGKSLH
ncbi:MAG TPA: hypothetical protein VK463_21550 [Desulfomonilaceae bacterium]|nr:hypothetical protein [Desulfomonilaceae bacterium]